MKSKGESSSSPSKRYGSLDMSSPSMTSHFADSTDFKVVPDESVNIPTKFGKVKGPPVVLTCQMKISFIEDLDIVNGTFFVKCFIENSWYSEDFKTDYMAKENKKKVDFVKLEKEGKGVNYWKPKIKFKNTSKALMSENYGVVDSWKGDPKSGMMKMRTAYQGRANCTLDLRHFPFDKHDLIICLHFMNKDKRVWLVDDSETTSGKSQIKSQEWVLLPASEGDEDVAIDRGWSDPEDSTSKNLYPAIRARVRIAREYGYYVYNTVLIVLLITLMTLGAICCPPDDIGDRLNVTLTVMLTTVAIKWTIDERTPAVPYQTLMDKFLIGQMVIIYMMFFFNCAIAKFLLPRVEAETVEFVDDMSALIWIFCYIYAIVYPGWMAYTARFSSMPIIPVGYLQHPHLLDCVVPSSYKKGLKPEKSGKGEINHPKTISEE